jgi:hypothetical protein
MALPSLPSLSGSGASLNDPKIAFWHKPPSSCGQRLAGVLCAIVLLKLYFDTQR